jgi:hypothetical protein
MVCRKHNDESSTTTIRVYCRRYEMSVDSSSSISTVKLLELNWVGSGETLLH